MMKQIVLSAYYCNPYLPSEASGAFKWLQILLKKYSVILLTNEESNEGVMKFYDQKLPERLKILTFDDTHFLKDRFRIQVHFGYFAYNRNLRKYIKSGAPDLKNAQLIIHKNPTSFRYPTCLYLLDIPLIIGPIGGGLQVPKELQQYFKKEPLINRLRIFDQYLLKLPAIRRSYDKANRLLITLDYLKDILPKRYASKILVFFDTGIDVPEQPPETNSSELIRILYVGKLIRFKGAELAIRAVAGIKEPYRFDIVGDGVEMEYLKSVARELNCIDRINFHGNVSYQEVESYYANADIFLYPSLTEASGNVLLEAMKYALPIVAVDNGGARYMCPDDGTIKVPIAPPDKMVQSLHEGVTKLLISSDERIKMGRINHHHCLHHYSWQVLERKIIDLVDQEALESR